MVLLKLRIKLQHIQSSSSFEKYKILSFKKIILYTQLENWVSFFSNHFWQYCNILVGINECLNI